MAAHTSTLPQLQEAGGKQTDGSHLRTRACLLPKSLMRKRQPECPHRPMHEDSSCEGLSKRSRQSTIKALKKRVRKVDRKTKEAQKKLKTKPPPLSYVFCNKYTGCLLRASFRAVGAALKPIGSAIGVLGSSMSSKASLASTASSTNPDTSECANNRKSRSVLHVCQHWTPTREEIKRHLRHASRGQPIHCGQRSHGLIPSISAKDGLTEVQLVRTEDGSVVVTKQLVLAQCCSNKPFPIPMLQGRLEQLEQYFCPHVFMDRDGIEHHVNGTEPRVKRSGKDKCVCCGKGHHCRYPSCETSWRIHRRRPERRADSLMDGEGDEDVEEVVLEIERRLGKLGKGSGLDEVEDERWSSQLVREEEGAGRKKKCRYNEKTQRYEVGVLLPNEFL